LSIRSFTQGPGIYIAFQNDRDEVRNGDGKLNFLGAAIVESISQFDAVRDVHRLRIAPERAEVRNEPVEIPANKLPPEKYRNRLLTREEVLSLWPEVKQKRHPASGLIRKWTTGRPRWG
jgi:hypothetical protein